MMKSRIAVIVRHTLVAAVVIATAGVLQARPRPTPRPSPTPTPTPRPRSLADLARQLRLHREGPQGQPVTITNENLSSYAARGGLTTVNSTPGPGTSQRTGLEGAAVQGPASPPGETSPRDMWRKRYSDQKDRVTTLEHRRKELDSQIPALWNKFYAWDDPAYRDGVIKPELDAAIRERDQIDTKIEEERAKLSDILDQARRAGAKPGWFRDLR